MRKVPKKLFLFALISLVITGLVVPIMANFAADKAEAATITGSWVDQNTIIIGSPTGSHATYTLDSTSGNYVYSVPVPAGHESQDPNVSTCSNTISIVEVASPANSQGTIVENKWSSPSFLVNCEPLNSGRPQAITLTNTANAAKAPDTSSDASKQIGCEAQLTDPLTWIICPVVNALGQVVNFVDNLITNQLNIKTNAIFCDSTGTCQAYYAAWQSFRDIALGLMTIAGLIIIIAQALGLEILDAYTIRKALPRLLIAAIAITLSWPLMRFAINLSDDLGFGVRHLIYAPFSKLSDTVDLSFGGGIANQFFGFAAGVGTTAVAVPAFLLAGGAVSLLSFVGTAALAVLVAILVLILRQIAIILLMLLAPIAIVAYILPNTQRIYRLWWESFSKALLMFPLIAALIATGRVFSAIAVNNGQIINQIIGFVAYFAPYFMIPLTFRMAGSAVGGIGNFVQSRAQGGFQGLSKLRAGSRQAKRAQLKAGTALEGKKWIPGSIKAANRLNETTKGLGTGWNGRFGLGPRGSHARANTDQLAAEEALKEPGMQAIKGKNDFNRVLAEGMGDENRGRQGLIDHLMSGGDDGRFLDGKTHAAALAEAETRADAAVTAGKVAGRFTKAHGIAAFKNMARDGTAIRDTDDLARLAAIAGQGNGNNTFTFAAEAASVSRQVGRPDLAAASEPIGELAFAHSDKMFEKGLYNSDPVKADADLAQLQYKAWKSGAGGESVWTLMSNGKGRAVRNNAQGAADILIRHKKNIEDIQAGKTDANGEPIKRTYSDDQVQDAASILREHEMAIEQSQGKLNNRQESGAVLKGKNKEGEVSAYYEDYMRQPTGKKIKTGRKTEVRDAAGNVTELRDEIRDETNRDVVAKIVGDRYGSMTEEQKRALQEQGGEQEGPQGP